MKISERRLSEPYLLNEATIKAALIDYVIGDIGAHDCITRELPYSFNRRRADLVIIGKHFTAFEIKSDFDNLEKLSNQLREYKKSFHVTYVVSTQKHIDSIRKSAPKAVGIFLMSSEGIKQIRKALVRKRLEKVQLVSMVDRRTIERALVDQRIKSSLLNKMTLENLYDLASKSLTQERIEGLVRKELLSKYSRGFSLFMSERGEATLTDDLLLLGMERIIS
jgi:hypothetical protein